MNAAEHKHTKGRWEAGSILADGKVPDDEAIVYAGFHDEGPETEIVIRGPNALADAGLIAAAPDLLEAGAPIAALVAAIEGHHGFDDDKPVDCTHNGGGWNDFPPLTYGDLRKFAAAIAKAVL